MRDLATYLAIGARGPVIVGSGQTVADELERWQEEAGVDGFNVDYGLRGVDLRAFAEHVSPVLRERGLIPQLPRVGCQGTTLRARILGQDRLADTHPGARHRR